ncbi:MAG: proteinase inhibitor serpin [Gammaproteobacteria bacterium]|nr:proteinase inhibitor serpin [Gammaproteobacteria bacterium]
MRRKHGVLCLFVAATLFGAPAPHAALPPASVDVAATDNAFGLRLLNAVQKTMPSGNVVLSPVSAALNLSMALNGADGPTRREMLDALSLSESEVAAINGVNAQLIKTLRTPSKSITLSVANSLWVDSRRATLRPDYVNQMQAGYGAEMAGLDFSDPSATRRINSWASKETHGMIPKVIDRINPADLALLLSAVYFKGQWEHKFDKARTQQRDFTLAGGSVKQVPRMAQSGRFDYFETPQMQTIRLAFGEGDLVMELLLPAKSSSLSALEAELSPEHWKAWQAQYAPHPGTIELPRFELQSHYRLNEPLQTLGIRRAFDPASAQFTGMFSSAPGQPHAGGFFISSVLQSTYWKVDEEGSEAAAVTTTGVRATAVAHPEQRFQMIVDRPFFCAIEDRRSGALLFVGAIYDPGT